jgi:two-component sensor histidine kinase
MISSLLELHAFRAVNEQTLDLIRSAQLRIKSASLVHELLYNNSSLHYVDFRDYIFRLCEAVEMSMHDPKKNVHIHLVCDPLELNLDQGVPCGLLINELLTNAYKHAFSKKEEGNIYVRLTKVGELVSIEVSDDGGALDPNFDPEEVVSTGMILIITLCQQLEGNFTFSGGKTTSFKVEFENRNLLHESTDR